MRLWFKRDSSRARRSFRLWGLRARRTVLTLAGVALAGTLVAALWHNGALAEVGNRLSESSVRILASGGFRVENVLVTGRVRTPQQEVLSRLDIRQDMPLFAVDVQAAQERLAGISWIGGVSVSRRLPDTILVSLQERTPAALWQYQKKISVVDDEGHVLTTAEAGLYRDLPLVVGAAAAQHVLELKTLLAAEPAIAEALSSAVRVGQRRWDFHLENGMLVRLPERDAELALRRLARAAEEQALLDKAIGTVDLRVAGQMVVEPLPQNPAPAQKNKT